MIYVKPYIICKTRTIIQFKKLLSKFYFTNLKITITYVQVFSSLISNWEKDFPWCDLQNPFTWGYPSKHLIRPFPNHLSLPNILSCSRISFKCWHATWNNCWTDNNYWTSADLKSVFKQFIPFFLSFPNKLYCCRASIYRILELTCKTCIRYTVS